jgi:Salmonella virulence plasmid 65kDa B protein
MEGLFARLERWVHTTTHETHWHTITKDNVTSMYGGTAESCLADPDNA